MSITTVPWAHDFSSPVESMDPSSKPAMTSISDAAEWIGAPIAPEQPSQILDPGALRKIKLNE
eukprot:4833851-Amphidinium_carterae.1